MNLVFAHPGNLTTFAQKMAYVDALTDVGFGGMLGPFMLIVIFGCLYLMMSVFGSEKSLAVSAFISAFLGVLIRVLFPISDNIIYISIIMFVVSIFLLMKNNN